VPSFTGSNLSINALLDMVTPLATIAATQPLVDLVTSMPPPAKNTKAQPAVAMLCNAPEREAAGTSLVSMLAELNAITKLTT
jgi:hypothetical protein